MEEHEQQKMDALRTVLPLMHEWIEAFLPIGSGWDFDAEVPDEDKDKEPALLDPHDKRLVDNAVTEFQHEGWERVQMSLSRAYRLDAVWRSLNKLHEYESPYAHTIAAAVYAEYVEPWAEWEPDWRLDLAEIGLLWMAREIPGEVPTCEAGKRETWRARVKVLHAEGHSIKQIARVTGHSRNSVRAAIRKIGNDHRRPV